MDSYYSQDVRLSIKERLDGSQKSQGLGFVNQQGDVASDIRFTLQNKLNADNFFMGKRYE